MGLCPWLIRWVVASLARIIDFEFQYFANTGSAAVRILSDACLEEAYKVGQKPVGADMIENVLAKDINGLEPRLTREGTTRRS